MVSKLQTRHGMRAIAWLLGSLLLLLAGALWYRLWMNPAQADVAPDAVTEAVQVVTVINRQTNENAVSNSDVAVVDTPEGIADFDWQIPAWLPPPPVPADNPMNETKVSLGRHLFYDHRLSIDDSVACSSCHEQALGFSDGRARAVGVQGSLSERNSMGLANVGYSPALTWANPHLKSLERQALIPMFGEEPVEMGLAGHENNLFARLQSDPLYQTLFAEAFPDTDGQVNLAGITRALAAFQRTLISVSSAYDRYKYADESMAMSESALRGESLFFSETAECYHCHQGFNFTDTLQTSRSGFAEVAFYNTGLYNLDGKGAYPAGGQGLRTFSNKASDMGKFRTQSLRNVGVTAPYFHDGSAATLDEVIAHYASAGRTLDGPHAGQGSANPYKDPLIVGFSLDGTVLEDLKAFLHSLTDADFLSNPRFADPWPDDHPARGNFPANPSITNSTEKTQP